MEEPRQVPLSPLLVEALSLVNCSINFQLWCLYLSWQPQHGHGARAFQNCYKEVHNQGCFGFWTPLTSERQLQPFPTVLQHHLKSAPFLYFFIGVSSIKTLLTMLIFSNLFQFYWVSEPVGASKLFCPGVLHIDLQISFIKKCSNLGNRCCMMFARFEYQII